VATSSVYRLLCREGLAAAEMLTVHQPVLSVPGYLLRAGVHDVTTYDWQQFLNYADRHLRSTHAGRG
jgi:hypothetical protein